MRKSGIFVALFVLLAAAIAYAAQCLSYEPFTESFGYSSEEFYGGGSYLGVDTRNVTPDRMGPLKLKQEQGVEVTMVDRDAPAGKAGIKEHDVILSINGTEVESVEQLRRMIHEIPPGRVISVGISRDGQPLTLKAPLADRRKAFAFASPKVEDFHFEMPAMPDIDMPVSVVVVHSSMRSGLMVENLTPQLGDFLGAKDGQGVMVRSVDKGSHAEKAGFHAGDVIIRVNDERIHDAGDFTHALHSQKSGSSVTVGIIRDKKEQTLTLTLPEHRQSGGVFEESFEVPEIDAESQLETLDLQKQMEAIKPQLAMAAQQAMRAAREAQRQQQVELQKQQAELRQQRDERRKQMKEEERQLQQQRLELQEQLRQHLDQKTSEI